MSNGIKLRDVFKTFDQSEYYIEEVDGEIVEIVSMIEVNDQYVILWSDGQSSTHHQSSQLFIQCDELI